MEILFHEDERSVKAHSSIDQFRGFLSVEIGGAWTPIEYDYIDYIDCGKVVSHPVIVSLGDDIGYYFQDGECTQAETMYPTFDREGVVLKELPECMGEGFYEAYEKHQEIANFDDGTALGTRNVSKLRIGQDYFLADEILPADDID